MSDYVHPIDLAPAMTEDQARRFIEAAGKHIWGTSWRVHFEDRFGICDRRLRRMLSGAACVPLGLVADVEQCLRDHGQKLDRILEMVP